MPQQAHPEAAWLLLELHWQPAGLLQHEQELFLLNPTEVHPQDVDSAVSTTEAQHDEEIF